MLHLTLHPLLSLPTAAGNLEFPCVGYSLCASKQLTAHSLTCQPSPAFPLLQEMWSFRVWGKGVKDHYHPPAPLLRGEKKAV